MSQNGNEENQKNAAATQIANAAAIRVLPDMGGIVVTVDVGTIPIRRDESLALTVWTPDGHDTRRIGLSDRLQTTEPCASWKKPEALRLEPTRVSACAKDVNLRLLGENLTADASIDVGGVKATKVTELPGKNGLSFDVNVADSQVSKDYVMVKVETEGGEASVPLVGSHVVSSGNSRNDSPGWRPEFVA